VAHEELPRKGSKLRYGWLIRVTIIVRIARNVEMRPKDKARMSLIETSVPKLALTLQGTMYTDASCLLCTNILGRKGCQSFSGK
jgi:hypothetical protein